MNISKKLALLFCLLGVGVGTVSAIALQSQAAQTNNSVNGQKALKGAPFEPGKSPVFKYKEPRGWSGRGGVGTVTAINGSTITLTGKNGATYTVDASGATVKKIITATVANIAVGDTLTVQGASSGATINATNILDGDWGWPGPPMKQ